MHLCVFRKDRSVCLEDARHLTQDQAHVNNVVYARYAESSRVKWVDHFALHVDPARGEQWRELMQPRTVGLIMKSLTTEFKFVSAAFAYLHSMPTLRLTKLTPPAHDLPGHHRRVPQTSGVARDRSKGDIAAARCHGAVAQPSAHCRAAVRGRVVL